MEAGVKEVGDGEEERRKERRRWEGQKGKKGRKREGWAGEKIWRICPCCLCSWRREPEAKERREPLDKKMGSSSECLGGTQL